jgi:nickel/cobalt transporter (NicO) family protein
VKGRFLAACAIAAAFSLNGPRAAQAHPLGNFSINRYARIELARADARIFYVIDRAEIPALQERERIDGNADGVLSTREQDTYLAAEAARLISGLDLRSDDRRVALTLLHSSFREMPGQGGLNTHRIELTLQAAPLPVRTSLAFDDQNFADRLGWREFVVRAGPGIALTGDAIPTQELSAALTHYPVDPAFVKPQHNALRMQIDAQGAAPVANTSSTADVRAGNPNTAGSGDPLLGLLSRDPLTLSSALIALLAAFGWGMSHALSPGHGKTVAAAYLIGARATAKHALLLGATTTITHTASVFALGTLTLLASQWIVPERVLPWIEGLSGTLIIVLGLTLLRGRLRAAFAAQRVVANADHGGVDPSQMHDHGGFAHTHAPPGGGWRSILLLGATGGLLPCPSAMVVMLGALALGHAAFGLLLTLTFSAGLAAVLVAIGIALVRGRSLAARVRWPQLPIVRAAARFAPVFSAAVITFAGAVMTARAFVT